MNKIVGLVTAVIILSGCASNISPHTYSVGTVGQVNRTISATVISVREVDVAGTTGLGGGVGAVSGGVIGSAAGGGDARGNIIGAIAGAVVGGLAGSAIEGSATKQKGMEYVVETDNGNLMTMVQGTDASFVVGQKVLVLYGSPSRLIVDPRAAK